MQQCPEHDSGSSKAEKTDLGDTNLAHLLILETMVMVKDETIGKIWRSQRKSPTTAAIINSKTKNSSSA